MGANGKLARSGFCGVLGLTGEDKFAVDVLNRDMSRQKLKNLVTVCVGDSEGIWTLVKIACSQIGAKNLLDCGVGSELIRSCGVGEEIGEESSFVGAVWESRGRGGADGGKVAGGALFFGQLKLFGTLLCNLPKSAIVGSEASKFLRMRCVSGVEMLKNFPVDIELVGAYVEVLEALAGGGGWNVNTMGKVGGKIEQGVLSLGLHLSNFPVRRGLEEGRGVAGGGSWWDAINFEAMSSEERGMVGLGGLFNLGGWCERDYEYIEAGLKIAGSCLGFVRGIMERSPELMVVEATSLSRGLGVCVRLSRVLDTKLKNLIRANNLDESKLDDLVSVRVQGDDGDDVLIETKWVLLCGRRVRVVCENLLTIAALHLQKLRGKAEELGGGAGVRRGMETFAKVVVGGLSTSKVEALGLGGDGVEGVVDGGFSKKIARMLHGGAPKNFADSAAVPLHCSAPMLQRPFRFAVQCHPSSPMHLGMIEIVNTMKLHFEMTLFRAGGSFGIGSQACVQRTSEQLRQVIRNVLFVLLVLIMYNIGAEETVNLSKVIFA